MKTTTYFIINFCLFHVNKVEGACVGKSYDFVWLFEIPGKIIRFYSDLQKNYKTLN